MLSTPYDGGPTISVCGTGPLTVSSCRHKQHHNKYCTVHTLSSLLTSPRHVAEYHTTDRNRQVTLLHSETLENNDLNMTENESQHIMR